MPSYFGLRLSHHRAVSIRSLRRQTIASIENNSTIDDQQPSVNLIIRSYAIHHIGLTVTRSHHLESGFGWITTPRRRPLFPLAPQRHPPLPPLYPSKRSPDDESYERSGTEIDHHVGKRLPLYTMQHYN